MENFFTRPFSNSAEQSVLLVPRRGAGGTETQVHSGGWGKVGSEGRSPRIPAPSRDSHLERRAGCLLAPSGGQKPHSGASTGRRRGGGGARPPNPPFNSCLNRAGLGWAIWSPATDTEGALCSFQATFPARGRLPLRICSTFEKGIHLRGGGFA